MAGYLKAVLLRPYSQNNGFERITGRPNKAALISSPSRTGSFGNGAPAIAWPHHKAESPNLTIEERKQGAEVLIKTVAKRVPVSIFAAALSEEDALDIARHLVEGNGICPTSRLCGVTLTMVLLFAFAH